MGRPAEINQRKNGKTFTFWLDKEVYRDFKALSIVKGSKTISGYLRKIVDEHLEQEGVRVG